jgi:uncharacterized protein YijF (DUF1287 family)
MRYTELFTHDPIALRVDSRPALGLLGILVCVGLPVAQTVSSSASARAAFTHKLVAAAVERTTHHVRYDSAYVHIPYPNGDVPADTGVCTDEIIRIYRAVGVDLQKEVHEDMQANYSSYPNHALWRLSRTDTNIDHRRVPNLRVFFSRKGEKLGITRNPADYAPGDLVTWDLAANVTHIGMVVDRKSEGSGRYMIVHNIGGGPQLEDVLFNWKITGHYRYFGPTPQR